jgi:glycosyltransferase involved in cell wall biosynthesis
MARDISVVVPSYNSALTIRETLGHLLSQKGVSAKEIVVVDSSDDGKTPAVLDSFKERGVRVVHLTEKTMPGIARNLGAEQCTAEVIAFIDSDAYPAPDWLLGISRAVDAGCRIGGGSIKMPEFQKANALALAQYFLQFNEFLETGARRVKMFVPSVNLFCETALFKEAGGFPELRASEDVLFCLEAGKRTPVYFEPSLKIYHIFREEMGAYIRNQTILGKSILIYRRMHYNSRVYRGMTPAVLLPAFVALKFFRIVWRVLQMADIREFGRFIYSLPLFLVGLWYWSSGFFQGCFETEKPRA